MHWQDASVKVGDFYDLCMSRVKRLGIDVLFELAFANKIILAYANNLCKHFFLNIEKIPIRCMYRQIGI